MPHDKSICLHNVPAKKWCVAETQRLFHHDLRADDEAKTLCGRWIRIYDAKPQQREPTCLDCLTVKRDNDAT